MIGKVYAGLALGAAVLLITPAFLLTPRHVLNYAAAIDNDTRVNREAKGDRQVVDEMNVIVFGRPVFTIKDAAVPPIVAGDDAGKSETFAPVPYLPKIAPTPAPTAAERIQRGFDAFRH